MTRLSATDAAVQVMLDEGVEIVFGIPGGAILPLYQSIWKSGKIRNYLVRHEQGGTHAADGYARATGKVGVMLGTSGPAGTNMITGLYTATADFIPLICITGQAPTHVLHKEAFQSVDMVGCATPVTKWSVMVKEPAQLPWVLREAFRIAQDGRPGAVVIDLPLDIQRGLVEYDAVLSTRLPRTKPAPVPAAIERAFEMLLAAERPLLLLGGGVIGAQATDEVRALAEQLQIPVSVTLMGKGGVPEDHPLYAGMAGIQTQTRYGNQLFLESDLVLSVGARFAERHTGDLQVYRGSVSSFTSTSSQGKSVGCSNLIWASSPMRRSLCRRCWAKRVGRGHGQRPTGRHESQKYVGCSSGGWILTRFPSNHPGSSRRSTSVSIATQSS